MPHESILTAFADSVVQRAPEAVISIRRDDVSRAVGLTGLVDTAAAIAAFNAVVKLADGTGMPLEPFKIGVSEDIRAQLGLLEPIERQS